MQISFDPLQKEEAAAVRAMLDALHAQQVGVSVSADAFDESVRAIRNGDVQFPAMPHLFTSAEIAAKSDAPFHTIAQLQADGHLPTSAAPLAPPVPSTAAADLFATAPAAPQDGQATSAPPPPVPVPPAPSAPAASPSPAGVDSTGLPWDERIHSGTKAVNADGTWRARRGLNNPALVKEVEAQLRQLAGIPVSAGPLPPAPSASAPGTSQQAVEPISGALNATAPAVSIPSPPAASVTTPVGSTEIPTLAPVVVPPAPPVAASDVPNAATTTSAPPTAPIPSPPAPDAPPVPPAAPITFAALMTKLAKAVNERRITAEQVDEIVARHGIPKGGMGQLVGKLDLVQLIDTEATLLGA